MTLFFKRGQNGIRQPAPQPLRHERREIDIAGRLMPLSIRENPRSRRMTLRIEPGGRALSVSVPPGLAQSEIDGFLQRQQGWLMTRLARFATAPGIEEGALIPLRGVKHRIRRSGKLRSLTRVIEAEDEPILEIGGAPEHLRRRLRDFLRKEAKADLEAAVARHAAHVRNPVRSIALKDTRSRWGSCSADGALSFSWRIVMAPPDVLDYLAAHEVAHLDEMNHGPRFWALCERLCPHTERSKAWLKKHGSMLHALDFD